MKAQRECAHTATCELLDLDTLARSAFVEDCFLLAGQKLQWEPRKELGLSSGLATTREDRSC